VNVVVIGGAGFVGSHLVDRLLAEGHVVDVVDDLSHGSLANLADARASGGSLKIHHLDAASPDAATLIGLRRPDVVYLLALLPNHDRSVPAQAEAFRVAVATAEAARRHGVPKVVVALPASVLHGQPAMRELPVKEGEIGQLVPRGVRGVVAKAIAELFVAYRDLHSLEFTALAFATVYGPRQRPDGSLVAALHDAARSGGAPVPVGDGRRTRDLLYVDDAVDALVRAADRGGGLMVNVGTGEQTSVADLWSMLAPGRAVPVDGPRSPRPDDLPRFAVSPVRARIHLQWSPWTTVEDGLARLDDAAG
jgi:UDP-glucose 4-epimerase